MLKISREYGVEAFVQAGSSSEYGLNCTAPAEESALVPNSDYAVSKGAASLLISYYGKVLGFPCLNLRLYSIYGPFEERDRLFPRLIEFGLNNKFPPLVGPEISRDFVYVDDATEAILRAAVMGCTSGQGESVNIASGIKTTLGELANKIKVQLGISQEPVFGAMPPRKWDLSNWYGDPSKAKSLLKWQVRTGLADGIALMANWEKEVKAKINFGVVSYRKKKISAIIACYKDAEAIPIMYERLVKTFTELNTDYEIIFVNDCSPHSDEAVISTLSKNDAHVIGVSHSRNFGSQAAFVSGMEISTGDAVVLLDGDLQDPPEVIPSFVKKWEEGYDVIYGERAKRKAPLYMQLFYKIFYRIFRKLSDVPIPLDAGDFSLMDRKVVQQLLMFPERDQFLRGLRAWVGFRQTGVPYVRPERMFGVTTNSFFKNIMWAKKAIFSFSIKPLNYMQAVGVSVLGSSFLLLGWILIYYFLNPDANPRGTNTILVLVLLLGGVQIFSISIVGDYIGKILEEVKARPKFIRSRVIKGSRVYEGPEQVAKFFREKSYDGKH